MVEVQEVFGLGANVNSPSYVDRGGLDAAFQRALRSSRHIAVHGGSKQGKSWLRLKGLPERATIHVQCTPGSTAESLLSEALGQVGVGSTLKFSSSRQLEGTLDISGNVELGKWLAKAQVESKLGGAITNISTVESEPIGQTAADLAWVSSILIGSTRRLVFEDFHYVSEQVQEELAFLMKAMGEYGLYVIVIGVWPTDHMLTYYNGDLDGRVEDIHLTWNDAELAQVLRQGADALGAEFSDGLIEAITQDASGNVGLVHRLAERICISEGVLATQPGSPAKHRIEVGSSLVTAQREVAEQMGSRFQTFADNFVRGMRRLPKGLEVYKHLLQSVTILPEADLLGGIDSAALLTHMNSIGATGIRPSDLTQALDRIDALQAKINVRPPVLTYNKSSRKLSLADRAFLFYRRHTTQSWPWASDAPEIVNDLATQEPLDMDWGPGFDAPGNS